MSYDPNSYGPAPAPREERSGPSPAFFLLLVMAFVLGGTILYRYVFSGGNPNAPLRDPDAQARPVAARGDLAADEQATIDIYESCSPSVVHITTSQIARDRFNFNPLEVPRGAGSGFIWDGDGHIVTNFHVIENANKATVRLADQSSWPALLVGVAPEKDIAVLKIEAEKERLAPIPVGSSADLKVGQKVFAIGSPFGLDQTMTAGIISALGREIKPRNRVISDVIQTDAEINPGNSGGPLLDSAGRLIGVNTAIYSRSGENAGIGFAIPVDEVNRVVPQLIRGGKIKRPGLGIQVARQTGIDGVLVLRVFPGSAAEKAGIRPTIIDKDGAIVLGDIIISAAGQKVSTLNDLFEVLEEHKVGDLVELAIIRNPRTKEERAMTITVQLQDLPSESP